MRRAAMALTALALVAGCSGGEGDSTSPSPPGNRAGGQVDHSSAEAIARALNAGGFTCTGWTLNPDAFMVKEDGACTHGADDLVSVTVYQNREQFDQFLEAFAGFTSGHWVK